MDMQEFWQVFEEARKQCQQVVKTNQNEIRYVYNNTRHCPITLVARHFAKVHIDEGTVSKAISLLNIPTYPAHDIVTAADMSCIEIKTLALDTNNSNLTSLRKLFESHITKE